MAKHKASPFQDFRREAILTRNAVMEQERWQKLDPLEQRIRRQSAEWERREIEAAERAADAQAASRSAKRPVPAENLPERFLRLLARIRGI